MYVLTLEFYLPWLDKSSSLIGMIN